MKLTRRGFAFVLPWLLISCRSRKGLVGLDFTPLPSPSGRYHLNVTVNQSNADPTTYLCLVIHLLDEQGQELAIFQTHASHRMKWAIGWMPPTDVVVLSSRDVGTVAWTVNPNEFEPVPVNPAMLKWAEQLQTAKYGSDGS